MIELLHTGRWYWESDVGNFYVEVDRGEYYHLYNGDLKLGVYNSIRECKKVINEL